MKTSSRLSVPKLPFVTVCVALSLTANTSRAAQQNFNGSTSGSIEVLSNYDSGSAVPANDTSSDVLSVDAMVANQPRLAKSRSLSGFLFSGTAGGFSLTSNSSNFILTLGNSGIQSNNTSGTNTIGSLTGTQNFALSINSSINVDVAAGGTLQIYTGSSGAGSLNKTNQGTLALNAKQNFGGTGQSFTITDGTVSWTNAQSFGQLTNVINIGSTVVAPNGTIALTGSTLGTYAGINVNRDFTFNGSSDFNTGATPITLNGSGTRTITNSQSGTVTVAGTVTRAGVSTLNFTGAGATVVSGKIQDGTGTPLSLTYSGSNTLTLSGVNAYTGTTTVSAGTLSLSGAAGGNSAVVGSILVTGDGSGAASGTAGLLQLAANDQIAQTSSMTLGGGTFAANGHNETLGALTLTGAPHSFINFGGAAGILTFADSRTSLGSGSLDIQGWIGSATGGGSDQIVIGAGGAQNLSGAQLAQIRFVGLSGGSYTAKQLGSGEVVPDAAISPSPEPSGSVSFLIGTAGTGLLIARRRKRRSRR